jgi:hypothetical protein
MCLSHITKQYRKPTKQIETGWKGFYTVADTNKVLITPIKDRRITTGVWVKDKARGTLVASFSRTRYPKGFHISKTRKGANAWGIPVKVRFRGVVARGKQNGCVTVVAREILILKGQ